MLPGRRWASEDQVSDAFRGEKDVGTLGADCDQERLSHGSLVVIVDLHVELHVRTSTAATAKRALAGRGEISTFALLAAHGDELARIYPVSLEADLAYLGSNPKLAKRGRFGVVDSGKPYDVSIAIVSSIDGNRDLRRLGGGSMGRRLCKTCASRGGARRVAAREMVLSGHMCGSAMEVSVVRLRR